MITKVEQTKLIQKCECGHLRSLNYSDLTIRGSFIHLPVCNECNTRLEVLHLNDSENEHSLIVARVFAKVATQG